MADEPRSDPIARQYEDFPYPPPNFAFDPLFGFDYRISQAAIWPDREPRPLAVLVAGCGTQQAAGIAQQNPSARVLGIDVSRASLAVHEQLKLDYRLDNLSCRRLSIESVASLGQDFDLIISTGVLHHLKDPTAGLAALRGVLKADGAIQIMLYGRYGRLGINLLRDLFDKLGLDQDEEGIAIARDVALGVEEGHPAADARSYLDLNSDAGTVDLLLNRREEAYTVGSCLGLLRDAGLVLQSWYPRSNYYPNATVEIGGALHRRLEALTPVEQWKAMEMIKAPLQHRLLACHPARPREGYEPRFDDAAAMRYRPIRRPMAIGTPHLDVSDFDSEQLRLFHAIDGTRTLQDCVNHCRLTGNDPALLGAKARRMLEHLWRIDVIDVRF